MQESAPCIILAKNLPWGHVGFKIYNTNINNLVNTLKPNFFIKICLTILISLTRNPIIFKFENLLENDYLQLVLLIVFKNDLKTNVSLTFFLKTIVFIFWKKTIVFENKPFGFNF